MIKYTWCLLITFFMLAGNPQIETIINEFQTAASGNDMAEFHPTWIGGFSLLNIPVTTIAGTALIDTDIILNYDDYVIIDDTVLSGAFYLPADSGFIIVYVNPWLQDSIFYPFFDSVPNSTSSASKFHRWASVGIDQYRIEDWYIDYSPTFGLPNDDYPGCKISGTVRCDGNPIPNACVNAASVDTIYYNPESLFLHKTTYTASDGSFSFEYLFSIEYEVTASAAGYESQTNTTPRLHAMQPLAGFDFNLTQSAIDICNDTRRAILLKISANPFNEEVNIELGPSAAGEKYTVKIFDISCRLVRHLAVRSNRITWNGRDEYGKELNPGIYFMLLPDNSIKLIKL